MPTPAQTLARQRILELRRRQTAFNAMLNEIVHQLSAPSDPETDKTPEQWSKCWISWQVTEDCLKTIADGLAPPNTRRVAV